MFALGQRQHDQQSGTETAEGAESSLPHPSVPVIEVPEDCAMLRLLLRWIYPPSRPSRFRGKPGLELEGLKLVLAAAHKYQMDGVVLEITDILINDCSKAEPLRVYATGARHRLPDVMQAAARCFLTLTTSDANAYVEELEDISGGAYYRLCEYRRQCVAALADMAKDVTWLANGGWAFKRTLADCICAADPAGTKYRFHGVDAEHVLSAWFIGHYQRMGLLLQGRPCREAIAGEELCEVALKEGSRCSSCREVVHNHMRIFAANMKKEINDRLAKISLKLD